jgi:hypothetical protein
MTAQKSKDAGLPPSVTQSTPTTTGTVKRKAWVKKTPVEVVLDQINRLKDDVAKKEEEFKQAKRQLEKLEAARKILEAT